MGAFDEIANILVPDPDKPASEEFRKQHGEDATEEQEFLKKWKWDRGEQVIMRGAFTAADHEAVENASSPSAEAQSGKKVKEVEARVGTGHIKLLERMIVDWTFAQHGRKVSVSPQSIKRLPSNYMIPLLEKCDEIAVAGMDEEAQKDFLPGANGLTKESSTMAK